VSGPTVVELFLADCIEYGSPIKCEHLGNVLPVHGRLAVIVASGKVINSGISELATLVILREGNLKRKICTQRKEGFHLLGAEASSTRWGLGGL